MMRSKHSAAFTLIEVMIAIAILGVGLSAIFSSEVQSIYTAAYARNSNTASLLARCKMGEIEEQVMNEGLPAIDDSGTDGCCEDAEVDGFTCEWRIDRVVLPEGFLEEGDGGGQLDELAGDEGAQTGALDSALGGGGLGGGGFAEMAISIAFPVMKPAIEEQVRRATVTVKWEFEGASRPGGFDVVQYLVAPQAPPDPNAPP